MFTYVYQLFSLLSHCPVYSFLTVRFYHAFFTVLLWTIILSEIKLLIIIIYIFIIININAHYYLLECLFGQAPFSSRNLKEVMERIKSTQPIEVIFNMIL